MDTCIGKKNKIWFLNWLNWKVNYIHIHSPRPVGFVSYLSIYWSRGSQENRLPVTMPSYCDGSRTTSNRHTCTSEENKTGEPHGAILSQRRPNNHKIRTVITSCPSPPLGSWRVGQRAFALPFGPICGDRPNLEHKVYIKANAANAEHTRRGGGYEQLHGTHKPWKRSVRRE